VPDFVLNF